MENNHSRKLLLFSTDFQEVDKHWSSLLLLSSCLLFWNGSWIDSSNGSFELIHFLLWDEPKLILCSFCKESIPDNACSFDSHILPPFLNICHLLNLSYLMINKNNYYVNFLFCTLPLLYSWWLQLEEPIYFSHYFLNNMESKKIIK